MVRRDDDVSEAGGGKGLARFGILEMPTMLDSPQSASPREEIYMGDI